MERHIFDAEYVERLRAGDPATEEHFSRYFGELLHIKLRGRLNSPEAIADAKQETFLRVFALLRNERIEKPEALGAIVNTVCNNVLFEAYRANSKVEPALQTEEISPDPSIEASLVTEEERAKVRSILAEMPPRDSLLLRSVFFEEKDKSEICRQFGVDREYLRVIVHRAKLRFRSSFLQTGARIPRADETLSRKATQKG